MLLNRPGKLIKELSGAHFIPFFNHELVKAIIDDYRALAAAADAKKGAMLEEKDLELSQRTRTAEIITILGFITRIFRCMLAYINFRLVRVKEAFWKCGGGVTAELKEFMSPNERLFHDEYRKMIIDYQKSFPIDLDLLTDIDPPRDFLIEVRVLEDCGEIVSSSGEVLNLKKNHSMLVRRSDVEHLIRQQLIVQTK